MTTARINDAAAGRFIIDTGASVVSLSPELAQNAGVKISGEQVWLETANGLVRGNLAIIDSVDLAGLKAHRATAVILPEAGTLDGVLGLSFLSRFSLEFDPSRGRLVLSANRTNASSPKDGQPVRRSHTSPMAQDRKGCQSGNAEACSSLSQRYLAGKGVKSDQALAITFAKLACEYGSKRDCA